MELIYANIKLHVKHALTQTALDLKFNLILLQFLANAIQDAFQLFHLSQYVQLAAMFKHHQVPLILTL